MRFRGGSDGKVEENQTASNSGAEKPKKQLPKATQPEGRTLIATQSGTTRQWPGASGTAVGGLSGGADGKNSFGTSGVGSEVIRSGSAYGEPAYSNNDQQIRKEQPAGYLPSSKAGGSAVGLGKGDFPLGDVAKREVDNALPLNPSDTQKQPVGRANPFSIQPKTEVESASARVGDEAVASDTTDSGQPGATQAGMESADPFSTRRGGQFQTEFGEPSTSGSAQPEQTFQSQNATAAAGHANAYERRYPKETGFGEAENRFPSELRVTTGADRLNGNGKPAMIDEHVDRIADADHKTDAGKLSSVKAAEMKERQPNLAGADEDLASSSALPFRKPQSAAAPARLDDVALEGDRQPTLPIQSEEAADVGRAYAVAADDTYWSIAKKTYGSGAYFKALYEHNRRQLNNAGSLRSGMQLMLPDEATLQRLYPTLCPRPQRVAAATRATRASAALHADGREYVVNEGDTLYDVARRQLGNAKRFAEIYELNREAIGAPGDRLEPGTRLVLPAKN
jgi:nucleoid-associated protein YgaU